MFFRFCCRHTHAGVGPLTCEAHSKEENPSEGDHKSLHGGVSDRIEKGIIAADIVFKKEFAMLNRQAHGCSAKSFYRLLTLKGAALIVPSHFPD